MPVAAQADQEWSVHAFGIRVGQLTLSVDETATTYTGQGQFQTTGLAGVVADIRFDIQSSGRREGPSYRPQSYQGSINTGRRQSITQMDFSGPVPIKTAGEHAPTVPIERDKLFGAIDPMTMMWRVLQDRKNPCQLDAHQFDGTRLVAIRLTGGTINGDQQVCKGTYHRLGGYAPEDLEEITVTPLEVTFQRTGALWRAQRVWVKTRHGPATLKRRDTD